MLSKTKNWLGSGQGKPKNVHSLEHLRYLYQVLIRNSVVTEQNRGLLVETVRSMSEILIWGDQNDSSVFDFFLEKNMLLFFLKILRQKTGRYICVQLLQTLNILFENIRNETSLYYLLSNNHVNSIIEHRFDFSDEEVLAYYISFLKTLSFKLNVHTIHFFYNEHTNDFALYTEAIKFFNHPESMVRIAVRTLTLNVYKVNDNAMLMYIRNKTAVPYFSNLVWFIGNHVLELDSCVRNDIDHQSRNRLSSLVAEHLDHLHYVNDILNLRIEALNDVLTDHLLNRLLIPLYVDSLTKERSFGLAEDPPHISSVVSLFLLSQVFLILDHPPLVSNLAGIFFHGNEAFLAQQPTDISGIEQGRNGTRATAVEGEDSNHCDNLLNVQYRGFVKPQESLERSLESNRERGSTPQPRKRPNYRNVDSPTDEVEGEGGFFADDHETHEQDRGQDVGEAGKEEGSPKDEIQDPGDKPVAIASVDEIQSPAGMNCTDEEKTSAVYEARQSELQLSRRPYLQAIINALDASTGDYRTLISLCLLYAMGTNEGIKQDLLVSVCLTTRSEDKTSYSRVLVNCLIAIIGHSCQFNSRIRPVTLEMSSLLLKQLVYSSETNRCFLEDKHLASIEGAKEESMLLLRNFYRGDELFLDMFDDEYQSMMTRPLNVEYLMMDESIILPPTGTPLTGIDFIKRLPSGELERTRRAIRVFFLLRNLSLTLRHEPETKLPLASQDQIVKASDKLDLNNSDLIACTVLMKDKSPQRVRRFLVIDNHQLILVEPDSKKLGWGVARFVGPLQDLEVTGDKDDSRSLHVTIHKRMTTSPHAKPIPLLAARFQFDDHIRCMAAKQRLTKGRQRVRQAKTADIAALLEIPSPASPTSPAPPYPSLGAAHPGSARPVSQQTGRGFSLGDSSSAVQRAVAPIAQVIGARRGLFSSANRRHSDPQTKGQPQASTQGQETKGATGSGTAKSKPKPLSGSPSHNTPKTRWARPRKTVTGSPEVEEAKDAMSPSAFGTPPIASQESFPIQLDFDSSSSGNVAAAADSDDDDNTYQPMSELDTDQSTLPPTLSKSKAPPLTLIPSSDSAGGNVESPKLLPPASEERVRSFSSTSSDSAKTSGPTSLPLVSPFAVKSPATIDVNPISASADTSETTPIESAQASLSRLSQSWKDLEPDQMELKQIRQGSQESDDGQIEPDLLDLGKTEGETQMAPADVEDKDSSSSASETSRQGPDWVSISDRDSLLDTRLSMNEDPKGSLSDPHQVPQGVPSLDESLQNMVQAQMHSLATSDDSSPSPPGEIV
ncbi:protein CLEC16A-like [Patiria miniata]|uniref:Protein CLEC16A n=1 Tax=Patiria miniata TaxID=46514 RepID=A0A914AS62_PATMI|nr:protein CLEC16A-like [Patiria miniata]